MKANFSKKESLKVAYCVSSCEQTIDNDHLTWCEKFNLENDFMYSHLLNGNLMEKINTLKQITSNVFVDHI